MIFTAGSVDFYVKRASRTHKKLAAYIAIYTDIPVLIFNYPLAPENPYPAALNCSEEVYLYLVNAGIENIIVGGDSAGGGLAVSLALILKDKKIPLPKGIFALSPFLDLSLSGDTMKTHANKNIELSVWEGMWHVFQAWAGAIPEADKALNEINQFIMTIIRSGG